MTSTKTQYSQSMKSLTPRGMLKIGLLLLLCLGDIAAIARAIDTPVTITHRQTLRRLVTTTNGQITVTDRTAVTYGTHEWELDFPPCEFSNDEMCVTLFNSRSGAFLSTTDDGSLRLDEVSSSSQLFPPEFIFDVEEVDCNRIERESEDGIFFCGVILGQDPNDPYGSVALYDGDNGLEVLTQDEIFNRINGDINELVWVFRRSGPETVVLQVCISVDETPENLFWTLVQDAPNGEAIYRSSDFPSLTELAPNSDRCIQLPWDTTPGERRDTYLRIVDHDASSSTTGGVTILSITEGTFGENGRGSDTFATDLKITESTLILPLFE